MPVYVRKNLMSITPDTLSNLSSDDEDYVTDPDQMYDRLPQPFRLVDKIVNRIFDVAWDLISAREAAAEELRSREPVPEYDCGAVVRERDEVLCMCGSPDGSSVFLGLSSGLAVLHATIHNPVASWEQEGASVTSLDSTQIGVQMCLIASLDTSGVCRLFCFASQALLLLKTIDTDIPSGSEVVAMHLSRDGDYIALTIDKSEKETETETWIEVFKLPKDNWVRDVEAAIAKQQQQLQQQEIEQQKNIEEQSTTQEGTGDQHVEDTIEYSHPMEGLSMPTANAKSISSVDTPRTVTPTAAVTVPPTTAASTAPDLNPANLAKPTPVLKVRPLPDRLTATSSVPHPGPSTPATEEWCATIGQGNRHLILNDHLNTRRIVSDQVLGPYTDPKYCKSEAKPPRALCLFLRPGMMLASGNSSTIAQDQAHIFVASWSNSTNICLYNLLKNAKDLEHKPDQVWPNSAKVTAMTTTPCTSLVAVGLEDGLVILWDKHLSLPIAVQKASTRSIQHLHILPPNPAKSLSCAHEKLIAMATKPQVSILACDSSGELMTVCCGYGDSPTVKQVYRAGWRDKRDGVCYVTPVNTIKDTALLVTKQGEVFLCNMFSGKKLCLVKLPSDFILKAADAAPVITVAATGQVLFVKGEKENDEATEKEENIDDGNEAADGTNNKPTFDPEPTIFAYSMHTFPCLTNLWRPLEDIESKAPTLLHTTQAKGRFDVLFSNRLSEQQPRQVRMQQRWHVLKQKAANRNK